MSTSRLLQGLQPYKTLKERRCRTLDSDDCGEELTEGMHEAERFSIVVIVYLEMTKRI